MSDRIVRAGCARRVGILCSGDLSLANGETADAIAVGAAEGEVAAVEAACRTRGWESVRIVATPDLSRALEELSRARVDVVFHLAESIGGDARMEAAAAWMLEWSRLPYTGSGPLALALALEKPLARSALAAAGVAIPEGFVLAKADAPLPRAFRASPGRRWIVKPSREDASHGISVESVVTGETELRGRCARVIETYAQPALVEEFVDGREINVSILEEADGPRVLPLAEIDFERLPAHQPRLVTYAAKWVETSEEYRGTPSVPARELDPDTERRVRECALGAWRAIGLSGYGRVDLRIDEARGPLVLDVNPNPDLSPGAGLARAAERDGIPHAELVARIVEHALRRDRASVGRAAGALAV